AVGLALQGSLSNFAAGVMIITFRPFRVGNMIEAGGVRGIVEEISIFHTILRTPDNLQVIVPNSKINDGAITNFSTKPTRRIDLTIGVSYSDDLQLAQQTIRRVVEEHPKILKDPAPIIGTMNLAASAVEIVVWVWVNAPDVLPTRFYLIETLKTELEKAGCSIPFQQHDVHLHPVPDKPLRLERPPLRPAA
ncbi:MAG TPA: mechanosensitive ion channel domain-containing protein, partial [Candidatus Synoicihabitans sp.]|nr:mechanosensitive ion channel domain-containing protein [Candidatus Synoicihabitans sp.]